MQITRSLTLMLSRSLSKGRDARLFEPNKIFINFCVKLLGKFTSSLIFLVWITASFALVFRAGVEWGQPFQVKPTIKTICLCFLIAIFHLKPNVNSHKFNGKSANYFRQTECGTLLEFPPKIFQLHLKWV